MSEEQQKNPGLIMEPSFQYQCRLCIWSREEPELYNWVCKKAIDGYPHGQIASMLIEHLLANHPEIKKLSKKSIWNHFSKHVIAKDAVEIQKAKEEFAAKPFKDKKLISESALEEIKALGGGAFDEHDELCKLYVKFREVHDQIYEMISSLHAHNSANGEVWSQNKIQTFTTMVNTQKSILAEISKMRHGDKLIAVATQYIVKEFTQSIVAKLSEEFTSLIAVMKRQGVEDSIIEATELITQERLANILVNEAEAAMGKTKQEFKLN